MLYAVGPSIGSDKIENNAESITSLRCRVSSSHMEQVMLSFIGSSEKVTRELIGKSSLPTFFSSIAISEQGKGRTQRLSKQKIFRREEGCH
jgi:hypothetical protein